MARKPRIHVPGGLYHVMLRGNGGQATFGDDTDRSTFCALAADGVARFGHRIHAYCLMSNHVHLAVGVGDTPVSRIVQNLAFRYTRAFNRRTGRTGHLFQGRFRSVLVDRDAYLLELVRYIHLNPVRAGLTREPAMWRWSGHLAYLGKARTPWLDTRFVLDMFDEHDRRRARRRYAGFVREGLGEPYREDFHRGATDGRVSGGDAFVAGVLGPTANRPERAPSLSAIIAGVCAEWSLDETALRDPGRRRDAARARAAVGWLAAETRAATLTQVASQLGRDIATLSRQVARLGADARLDGALGRRLEALRRRV
jgi:REP-associated tyrosine transposase